MKVRVKLISMDGLSPKGFDDFGEANLNLSDSATVIDLLNQIAIGHEETYMVLVNGETSPPSGRGQQKLSDGDEVAIFPPMQGGSNWTCQ